jgi:hypothetical protein
MKKEEKEKEYLFKFEAAIPEEAHVLTRRGSKI